VKDTAQVVARAGRGGGRGGKRCGGRATGRGAGPDLLGPGRRAPSSPRHHRSHYRRRLFAASGSLRRGRNWAAQWHLARAVGKRFRGARGAASAVSDDGGANEDGAGSASDDGGANEDMKEF